MVDDNNTKVIRESEGGLVFKFIITLSVSGFYNSSKLSNKTVFRNYKIC
jgi:hypothetical protein